LSDDERDDFKRRGRITWTLRVVYVIAFGMFVSWCSSRPDPTPIERQKALDIVLGSHDLANPTVVDTSNSYFKESSRAHCADRYPADFTMRAACERNAKTGFADFKWMWGAYQSQPPVIDALTMCFDRYTDAKVTDFMMVGACARNQQKALEELDR
jgi:hypothetical protein